MHKCNRCQKWRVRDNCPCLRFRVCCTTWDEDSWYEQWALSPDDAAESFVEDGDDERDVLDSAVDVLVYAGDQQENGWRFKVEAEATVEYSARQV